MPQLRTEDLEITFMETGTQHGKAVLLLHGWPDDASTWEAVIERLKDRKFRFVIPYLRGFGPSRFRNDHAPRTANGGILAMDAIALMNGLGIERFSVVGHDWGSHVAECLAIGWPDRVERIALLSSTPRMGGLRTPPFKQAQLYWYQWFMATKRGAEAIDKDRAGYARLQWENWAPEGWFDEATFGKVSKSFDNPDWLDVTLHSYRVRWEEVEPDPRSVWLEKQVKATKSLSLPAIFVHGMEDGVTPVATSEDLYKKFTGPFERILLQNVGHFPQREDPEAVARELSVFLQAGL
ncbi:pimeloyl-ACP methyl ester carboxylesterase [Rhizobium leguminosarum]|uniref:Pimeloyl-ACP methyl ester carboxylesterase n=2 Tax=Rhizobium leguminosarum TaxID=384 RepID=A0A7Z0E1V5_RHILE|nr:alpha/beta hydrolase [Rhizobium leguminosarum]MBB5663635.1 pimeloyl-ACP methyl ester carboxylesterase [Rhizobium leguminosarum]MBB6219858.1 pimeloyl-ACP methyl ester carboxylesterase [Rhizobium leguminosarum]NYJ13306.1 pimeloyl-ACP methyl ester carboxylesterase [Rhizobium leguminosarum]